MADMIVAGAGTEAVNGVYTDNLNGAWSKDESCFIFWDEGEAKWAIVFGSYQYYAYDNLGVSPLNKTWYVENGAPPVPTVTAAGGGNPPSSIINHIMHYRRLMSR